MKLAYQYMAIFFNFQTTSNHLHPLQVENCDSNSRLEVDEDDNGKVRLERVKALKYFCMSHGDQRVFSIRLNTFVKRLQPFYIKFIYTRIRVWNEKH